MLVNLVSRNGTMWLNFPLKSDGTLDPKEMTILSEITAWMAMNSEGISGKLKARDVRFTSRGKTLYAFAMGWPGKETAIGSLGTRRNSATTRSHSRWKRQTTRTPSQGQANRDR